MHRIVFSLALLVALSGTTPAHPALSGASAQATISPSERYVIASELELQKLLVVMREFMRDQKSMEKAMASMHAANAFEAVATAGYEAAKASAGDNREVNVALDSYRQCHMDLTHGGFGYADEADWDRMVADCSRMGELVKVAARTSLST